VGNQSTARVHEILVRQSTVSRAHPWAILEDVHWLIEDLMTWGAYLPTELPMDALGADEASIYDGEVKNGGHGQYLGNRFRSRGIPPMAAGIADICLYGLAGIGAAGQEEIYRELSDFVGRDADRAVRIASSSSFGNLGAGEIGPVIADLDRRYFACDEVFDASAGAGAWLLARPNLRPVSDADWKGEIAELVLANPLRRERLASRDKQSCEPHAMVRAEKVASHRKQIVTELCEKAGAAFEGILVEGDWLEHAGERGQAWHVGASGRHLIACFLAHRAILLDYPDRSQLSSKEPLQYAWANPSRGRLQ